MYYLRVKHNKTVSLMRKLPLLLIIIFIATSCNPKPANEAEGTETAETIEIPATPDGVYFIFPKDGETVSNPVLVGFGVNGMGLEPAGQAVEGMGHHHIVIDGQFVPKGIIVPSDSTHIHYGQAQKETKLDLAAGKHTLTMQYGDGIHKSYGEVWSKTIEITVADNK